MDWLKMNPETWYTEGKLNEAPAAQIDYYKAGLQMAPDYHPFAWLGVGNAKRKRKDYAGAVEAYQKALDLQFAKLTQKNYFPKHDTVIDMAKGVFDLLVDVVKSPFVSAQMKGQDKVASDKAGVVGGILEGAGRIVTADPDFEPAWGVLGQALLRIGQMPEATYCFDRAGNVENMLSKVGAETWQALVGEKEKIIPKEPTFLAEFRIGGLDRTQIEKLKKLVKVSKTLKITQMARMLGVSEDDLYEHVVNWADKFGFTIDQDVVDFGGGKKEDFIAELDQAFTSWGKAGKEGKV